MRFTDPNQSGSKVNFKPEYKNFIGGEFVSSVQGQTFEVLSPVNGKPYTKVQRSCKKDVELALDAAHLAAAKWNFSSATERSAVLNKIADRLEQNLEVLAIAETWGNGKPVRETMAADLPLTIDHFRYFAGIIRAEEGTMSELDSQTVSMQIREPLGVVGQIIPWNFPLLMAAWKIAPAIAAGNTVVLKPAEQTPVSVLMMAELIADILPKGVLNIVNGFGPEAGAALAQSNRIAKLAFTGECSTGKIIMQNAAQNLIPVTLELGGKSPNIFFEDILSRDDEFVSKTLEGFAMFALNQGEVCTSPSRALIQESIYDRFMDMAMARVGQIKFGHPLDTDTMIGAQSSQDQMDKILGYIETGKSEGAKLLTGGKKRTLVGAEGGYYIEPTVFAGNNSMKIFQEEIFGPVLAVTKFKNTQDALEIANDTRFGLGAGVWTRDVHNAYELGRKIKAGRVWTNCYHLYPAHAAFGGYKESGFGRETHKMMLSHYTQTKNILISYDKKPIGFF
jgi:aldehyde dehydrogenase